MRLDDFRREAERFQDLDKAAQREAETILVLRAQVDALRGALAELMEWGPLELPLKLQAKAREALALAGKGEA